MPDLKPLKETMPWRASSAAKRERRLKTVRYGWGIAARALADAGDVAQAEALAAKIDQLRPEDTLHQKVYLQVIRSSVELERGNAAKAVDLLAPVTQYEQGNSLVLYSRGQAYFAAGEHAKAAAEFEKLIGHRGWSEWEVWFATPPLYFTCANE